MAKVDDVLDDPLGREFIHAGSLAGHHVHEGAPGAGAVSHNDSDRALSFLLIEVLNLEKPFLGEARVVHVDHWNGSTIRVLV